MESEILSALRQDANSAELHRIYTSLKAEGCTFAWMNLEKATPTREASEDQAFVVRCRGEIVASVMGGSQRSRIKYGLRRAAINFGLA